MVDLQEVEFDDDVFPSFFSAWAQEKNRSSTLLDRYTLSDLLKEDPSVPDTSAGFYTSSFQEKWEKYNRERNASAETMNNLEMVLEGEAGIVMTGQQPGLLGGPLYTLYKAATACALASCLSRHGIPSVPVFWNHSDDHDISEIDRTYVLDRANSLIEISLGLNHQNSAEIHSLSLPEETKEVLSYAETALRETDFKSDHIELLKNTRSDNPGHWFSRIMLQLFSEEGLVLFEPYLARNAWSKQIKDHLANWERDVHQLREQGKSLQSTGYSIPMDVPDQPNLFYLDNGNRVPVRPTATKTTEDWIKQFETSPDRFSPGAALRPLIQDEFFPTRAYVAGPGEITYHAQLGRLYDAHDVSRPALFPRMSLTLIEGKVKKVIKKFGLDPEELLQLPAIRDDVLSDAVPDSALTVIDQKKETIEQHLEELKEETTSIEENLEDPWKKTRDNVTDALDTYRDKVKNAYLQQSRVGKQQMDKLEMNIFPNGKLQERVISPWHYFTLYSMDLKNELLETADQVLEHPFQHHFGYL